MRALAFLWFLVPGFFSRCGTHFQKRLISLDRFATQEVIILRIVRMRIKIAKKRHDRHFLYNINSGHRNPCDKRKEHKYVTAICEMMPPRRLWLRPSQAARSKFSAKNVSEISITKAIKRARFNGAGPSWLSALDIYVKDIQRQLLRTQRISFDPPNVALIEKDKAKKTFRPLATYSIGDQILIGCSANCLRETIDSLMSKASYAFRTRIAGESTVRQHHDAVDALRSFILQHSGALLYVAECDIQKFFDSVNHEVARSSLTELLEQVRKSGLYYDKRLIRVFDAYLGSYNFPKSIEAVVDLKLKSMGKEGSVPWVRGELARYYPDGVPEAIGVPQGGALSPIIANIVLHYADVAVEKTAAKLGTNNYFYARYCDDMILASPDEKVTRALFSAYIVALESLKLPFHPPKAVAEFSSEYFEHKSKSVYPFGAPKLGGVSPWVAFLGYHVRYDGKLRVRKSSIKKEIEKQISIYRDVIRSVDLSGVKMRVSDKQAHHRARMRLIAMSVGKAKIQRHGPDSDHEMCWVIGFELLKRYPHVRSQLRSLDRVRARLLTKLRFKLASHHLSGSDVGAAQKLLKYYGRPFSYFAQFHRKP